MRDERRGWHAHVAIGDGPSLALNDIITVEDKYERRQRVANEVKARAQSLVGVQGLADGQACYEVHDLHLVLRRLGIDALSIQQESKRSLFAVNR